MTLAGWWAEWLIVTGDLHVTKKIMGGPLFLSCGTTAVTNMDTHTRIIQCIVAILIANLGILVGGSYHQGRRQPLVLVCQSPVLPCSYLRGPLPSSALLLH